VPGAGLGHPMATFFPTVPVTEKVTPPAFHDPRLGEVTGLGGQNRH
jgi:hypothetical protein